MPSPCLSRGESVPQAQPRHPGAGAEQEGTLPAAQGSPLRAVLAALGAGAVPPRGWHSRVSPLPQGQLRPEGTA